MDNVGLIAINNGDLAQVILYSIDGFRVDSSTILLVINYRSTDRLKQTQRQVDEVVDIMKVNVDKVLERDAKLSELDDRADQLQAGAAQFDTNAHRLKRKMWWQNCKMWIILIVVIVVIIAVIAIWVAATQSN
ncbi:Vesicle-associated membrane 3 [Paramuricea clavata]|uniref:Vesicle-associated membrane 3 n=1 Tax=Paramuricea clavata TaxID=317549 RepID=A0A6S7JF23_PARCT|nr:Vesicle-associated membrane 3 [Paramuricea clavata]